jgi:hypothetical protein
MKMGLRNIRLQSLWRSCLWCSTSQTATHYDYVEVGKGGLTPQKLQLLGLPEHSDIVYSFVVWVVVGYEDEVLM